MNPPPWWSEPWWRWVLTIVLASMIAGLLVHAFREVLIRAWRKTLHRPVVLFITKWTMGRHHCGHRSGEYATDPVTGERVCLRCHNAGIAGTGVVKHQRRPARGKWVSRNCRPVIVGTVAGVFAGFFLGLTNAAIDYWRRPQPIFVVTLSLADGIQLSILNVGGRPLREGYFHVAVPEEYGPPINPQADLSRSDSVAWSINGVRCIDFRGAVGSQGPAYPGVPTGKYWFGMASPPKGDVTFYYYFSTPDGFQPKTVRVLRDGVHYAELKIKR